VRATSSTFCISVTEISRPVRHRLPAANRPKHLSGTLGFPITPEKRRFDQKRPSPTLKLTTGTRLLSQRRAFARVRPRPAED